MLTAASYTIAKIWKQPKYLRNEWIKKMWYIHTHTHTYTHTHTHTDACTHNGILLSQEKERNLAICGYMDVS